MATIVETVLPRRQRNRALVRFMRNRAPVAGAAIVLLVILIFLTRAFPVAAG